MQSKSFYPLLVCDTVDKSMSKFCGLVSLCIVFSLTAFAQAVFGQEQIVINEIHYNPDVKTDPAEFIELYNAGAVPVNMAGWSLTDALNYTFPATNIPPQGYLVVAQNPSFLATKYGATGALGPFNSNSESQLSVWGENIVLRNADGDIVDQVNYKLGFPWPIIGDPPGYSIELIHPSLDNDLGGSWRASASGSVSGQSSVLIPERSQWTYRKGTSEASAPTSAWRLPGFDDSGWASGGAPIGYGESIVVTPLNDMSGGYSSVFFRKTFVVESVGEINSLVLEAQIDDGAKIWINGTNVLNINMPASEVAYNGTATATVEALSFTRYVINFPGTFLVPGTNIIAVQAHNVSLSGSSDFLMDLRLTAQSGTGGNGPTPGRRNSIYTTNAPPQIRQVQHTPEQPKGGEVVKVTAKVTDPNGVASVILQYQTVEPGNYIDLADSAYTNAASWITVPMNDAGMAGDPVAGDNVFSVDLPASLQVHRRLIRYRITVTDSLGASVRVPYADDPQPNFAYFVYNGVPQWTGAIQPGAVPAPTALCSRLPRMRWPDSRLTT